MRRETSKVKRFGGNALGSPRFTFHVLFLTVFESILLMRRTLIDASKQRCATMRHDETLALPAIHAHRPVEHFSRSSRAAHGRLTRHDRTVL